MGNLVLAGATSGSITLEPTAVAGTTTLTLPTANGTVLTTGSSGQSIPKAALPTGSVLQVVNATYSTQTTTTSTAFTDTGLSATITPTNASSKILILIQDTFYISRTGTYADGKLQIVRGATAIYTQPNSSMFLGVGGASTCELIWSEFLSYYDSPATTSATTYKLQMFSNGGTSVSSSYNGNQSSITLLEIAA